VGFKQVFELFCDCWCLYRKYAVMDVNDKRLESLADETGSLCKKYADHIFAKDMILAVLNEIDSRRTAIR